jgi:hypothetical protein
VILSTDQGVTWQKSDGGITDDLVYDVFVDGQEAFASTSNHIWRSTDAGSTWQPSTTVFGSGMRNIAGTAVKLYAAGWGNSVYVSTDHGDVWTALPGSLLDATVNDLVVSGSDFFVATASHGIERSTDQGATWDTVNVGLPSLRTEALLAHDSLLFTAVAPSGIYRSSDRGNRWELANVAPISVVGLADYNHAIIALGINGGVWISNDDGTTWQSFNIPGIPNIVNTALVVDGYVYVGLNDNLVYKRPASDMLLDVSPDDPRSVSYTLFQNYPNPFNPNTEIRYQVPAVSDVKLMVYDILGREVTKLVNEKKAPGIYTLSFDGSGLASGVYIYRLTSDKYVESRKMLLMK